MTFTPRLDLLPAPQRTLWPELADIPTHFVLYGGTALALRLGHRVSIDFDFFSSLPLDHRQLEALPMLRSATTIQEGANERTLLVDRADGPVKISYFGGLPFGRIGQPERTDDGVVAVASLSDLAGTKIKALLQRVEAKDYRDIAALLQSGTPLTQILAAGRALFGSAFNPLVAQKALAYFRGGDLDTLDHETRALLEQAAIADLDIPPIEIISPRLD